MYNLLYKRGFSNKRLYYLPLEQFLAHYLFTCPIGQIIAMTVIGALI